MTNCEALDIEGNGRHCKKCNAFWYMGDKTTPKTCKDLVINELEYHLMISEVVLPDVSSKKAIVILKPFKNIAFFIKNSWKSPYLKWNTTASKVYNKLKEQFNEEEFLLLVIDYWKPYVDHNETIQVSVEVFDAKNERTINVCDKQTNKIINLLKKTEYFRKLRHDCAGYAVIFKKTEDKVLAEMIKLLEV